MTSRSLLLPVLVLFTCVLPPGNGSARDRPPVHQTLDVQIPVAPVAVTIAGQRHLAYELHVTNLRPIEVALTRIEVSGLVDLRESALANLLGRPGVSQKLPDRRVIGPGLRAVAYLWLPIGHGGTMPHRLKHRIEFDAFLPSGRQPGVVDATQTEVRSERPVVLGPPLRGGPWAALYDPTMMGGHRTSIYTIDGRARIPARYAIDWAARPGRTCTFTSPTRIRCSGPRGSLTCSPSST